MQLYHSEFTLIELLHNYKKWSILKLGDEGVISTLFSILLEENMKQLYKVLVVAVIAALALTACGGGGSQADNLLDAIKERGYILVSTDPNYAPQSFLNTEGSRPADSKCPSDALTTAEMQGFDVDVAIAIGDGLGVETCFATPAWEVITAGSWADKWDISVGSMTINTTRLEVLDFSVPYYYTPAVVAVRADSGFTSLADLDGQALCAGTSTTYEFWLNKDLAGLGLPESSIYAESPNVTVVSLETDQECAQAIAAGREDFVGYVTSETVVDANIAEGFPVVKLGSPVFSEDLAAALDKTSSLPTESLLAEVNRIFTEMHNNGALSALSNQWFELDLTQAPN
jgi:polar amino acid transport system substrate-binding protein